jgi:hypothetical protein
MRVLGLIVLIAMSLLWIGCKPDPSPMIGDDTGDDTGDDGGGGGDGPVIDTPTGLTGCSGPVPGAPQCANCIDDDGDGAIDSSDIECSFPPDNVESSFATGIPGDHIEQIRQDCFFDGDSSATNDGCSIHVCCLLGATKKSECTIGANQYNPAQCPPPVGNTPLSSMCTSTCGSFTLPGCDCFGCCTVCDPATGQCFDVATNPITSPSCSHLTVADPNSCKRCQKVTSCGRPTCGGTSCILCLGQDPADLPPSCNGTPACPAGVTSCASGAACPAGTYCHAASGCCVSLIL